MTQHAAPRRVWHDQRPVDHFDLNLFSPPTGYPQRHGHPPRRVPAVTGEGSAAGMLSPTVGRSVGLNHGPGVGRRDTSAELPGQTSQPPGRTVGTHCAKSTGCGGGIGAAKERGKTTRGEPSGRDRGTREVGCQARTGEVLDAARRQIRHSAGTMDDDAERHVVTTANQPTVVTSSVIRQKKPSASTYVQIRSRNSFLPAIRSLERRARYLFYCMFFGLYAFLSTISRQCAGRFKPSFAWGRILVPNVSSPLLEFSGPRRTEKGGMQFSLLWESMGNFCILAVFERYLNNAWTHPHQILFVYRTMSADVPPPPLGSIAP